MIDQLLATVTALECCEHGRGDFACWIAARPGMLLCDFCYRTAQVLATDIRFHAGRAAQQLGLSARLTGARP